jgi:hypothetical protein
MKREIIKGVGQHQFIKYIHFDISRKVRSIFRETDYVDTRLLIFNNIRKHIKS